MSQYQKGTTNLDFTEARDSEWQRHQLGHMQVYTSLQTGNHASNPRLTTDLASYDSLKCHISTFSFDFNTSTMVKIVIFIVIVLHGSVVV